MSPRLIPPRTTPPRLTLITLEKSRKKPRKNFQSGDVGMVSAEGMLPQSLTITITEMAIMPSIVPSQKISGR